MPQKIKDSAKRYALTQLTNILEKYMSHEIASINDVFISLEYLLGPHYFRQVTGEFIDANKAKASPIETPELNEEEEKNYTLSLFTDVKLWNLKLHLLASHSAIINRVS